MTNLAKNEQDRRVKRTKSQVFDAFFEMVQSSRYDEMKVIDIIQKSGVGKSTFYEHFNGKDDVLGQSLEYPLSVFASALIGDGDDIDTLWMLDHFWERRVFARVILQTPTRDVVVGCLKTQILCRLESREPLNGGGQNYARACLLSSGFLSLLTEWLLGRVNLSKEEVLILIGNFADTKEINGT